MTCTFPKPKQKKPLYSHYYFFSPWDRCRKTASVWFTHVFWHTHLPVHPPKPTNTLLEYCLQRQRQRERERGYIEQTGASAKAKSVPAPASPLCMAPVAPEIRPQANKPAWSCQGAQHGSRGGARWHFVARCHFLLPSLWLGSTGGKLRRGCTVCWWVYLVSGWEPTLWEGWKVLTPHSPSAVGWGAGWVSEATELAIWMKGADFCGVVKYTWL